MSKYFFILFLFFFIVSSRRITHRLSRAKVSTTQKGIFAYHERTVSDWNITGVLERAATSAGQVVRRDYVIFNSTTKKYDIGGLRDAFAETISVGTVRSHIHPDDPRWDDDVYNTHHPREGIRPLCASENHNNNWKLYQNDNAFCSGFLVSPNTFITAGHCVCDPAPAACGAPHIMLCDNFAIVMDFKPQKTDYERTFNNYRGRAGWTQTVKMASVPSEDVYFCKKIISRKKDGDHDYAVIQLDRDVTPWYPFIEVQDPTYFYGTNATATPHPIAGFAYPNAFSEMYDPDGNILVTTTQNMFECSLDGEGGSSGGLIASRTTGKAVGIQVAGRIGWQLNLNPTNIPNDAAGQPLYKDCFDRVHFNCGPNCPAAVHSNSKGVSELTIASSNWQYWPIIDHHPISFSQSLAKVNEKEGSARIKALQKLVGAEANGKWDATLDAAVVAKAQATHFPTGLVVTEDKDMCPGAPIHPAVDWTGYAVESGLLSMWLCEWEWKATAMEVMHPTSEACAAQDKSILAARELLVHGFSEYSSLALDGTTMDEPLINTLKQFSLKVGYAADEFPGLTMNMWRYLFKVDVLPPDYMPETFRGSFS